MQTRGRLLLVVKSDGLQRPAIGPALSTKCCFGWTVCSQWLCISLGNIQNVPTRSKFAIFQGFLTFWSNALKFRSVGGGMCMLFEICEKRPFQKCMGWGGGRWSQFCTKSCKRKDTQGTGNALRITHYSESDSLVSLRLSTRAGTPLVHTFPCL